MPIEQPNTTQPSGLGEPAGPVPTEGATRVRVRYAECDPMGVAHHASYAPWLEIARTELLRDAGMSYAAMEAAGVFLVVTRMEITYRRPIRYDDLLEVRVVAEPKGAVRIRHGYEVVLVERGGRVVERDGKVVPIDGVCAVAETELACVDGSGKPRVLPGWLGGRG
jgi:YbgC/YbaW family acyl-CoA thioester hydrolase